MDGQGELSRSESAVAGGLRRMREGEQATVGSIASWCATHPATVRRTLAAWELAGYVAVEQVRERADHPPARHYSVTEKGRAWLRAVAVRAAA